MFMLWLPYAHTNLIQCWVRLWFNLNRHGITILLSGMLSDIQIIVLNAISTKNVLKSIQGKL